MRRPPLLRLRPIGTLLGRTIGAWQGHNDSLLAAGISYFAIFSLVPLITLAVTITAFALGEQAAQGILALQLSGLVGSDPAESIQSLVTGARESGAGTATIFSAIVLLVAASRLFLNLQAALNIIWGERPPKEGALRLLHEARQMLVKRVLSFAMVLITGVLLLVSFFIDTALAFVRGFLSEYVTVLANVTLWEVVNVTVSFLLIAVMTACIYKFLPDTRIAWSDVWVGATLTSLLLTAGRFVIAFYFHVTDVGSVYGLTGSFVVIVVGVYLSAQVFLFGAEFTRVWCEEYGSKARRARAAQPVPRQARTG